MSCNFIHFYSVISWQIRVIDRNCEIPHEGPFCDLMWSDPEEIETWAVSPRGAGWLFGSRVTSEVWRTYLVHYLNPFWSYHSFQNNKNLCPLQFNHINNLDLVCRAHQLVQEGLKYMFQDKGLVTVSFYLLVCTKSAPGGIFVALNFVISWSIKFLLLATCPLLWSSI